MIIDNQALHDALNVVSFSEAVEHRHREMKFETYISAVVDLASELDIDDKDVPKLLSPSLIEKLRLEAEEEGHIRKECHPMMTF